MIAALSSGGTSRWISAGVSYPRVAIWRMFSLCHGSEPVSAS